MKIRQPVINTFKRVGLDYKTLKDKPSQVEIANWITGETCEVHPLVAEAINWVYKTQIAFDSGLSKVNISDFDRIRHWILEVDSDAYMTCID